MSTSFVVVPPNPFGAPYYVERLNHHFALHDDFEVHQIAVAVGCGLHEAQKLCDFLERLGYVEHRQRRYPTSYRWATDYYVPRLPLTFVASLESKPFAAGGRR